MPIASLEARRSIRELIKGKIRLGVTVEEQRGRPKTVDFFVVKDVPDVEKVYGPEPKELEVNFPHRNRDIVLPTWFRWFGGGLRDERGKLKGGELHCIGSGCNADGSAGTAEWLAKRDPITKITPTRPCLERNCPDFFDSKGNQQCKAGMRVLVTLPRVSQQVLYEINTTAWDSMMNFKEVFDWNLANPETAAIFTQLPFIIYREEKEYKVTTAAGKKIRSTQYIMKLRVDEDKYKFMKRKGMFHIVSSSNNSLLTTSDIKELEQQSIMDEHYFLPEESADSPYQAEVNADLKQAETSEALLSDPEIQFLFDTMSQIAGRGFTDKAKLVYVRKYEHKENFREAVVEALKASIESLSKRDPENIVVEKEEKAVKDSSGII